MTIYDDNDEETEANPNLNQSRISDYFTPKTNVETISEWSLNCADSNFIHNLLEFLSKVETVRTGNFTHNQPFTGQIK